MTDRLKDRDYLAGSLLAGLGACSLKWFSRSTTRLWTRAAAWIGFKESGCAVLLAAVIANGLTLWLMKKEIAGWGVALRGAVGIAAGLGFFFRSDWPSVRRSSFLMRLVGG